MKTKQTIAVIGNAGKMQTSLLKGLSKGNYRLLLCLDQPDQVVKLLEDLRAFDPSSDVETIQCAVNASWEADIILSSIGRTGEKEMAASIKEVACQKLLISVAEAPVSTPDTDLNFSAISKAAEELLRLLPNSKVVKVVDANSATDRAQTEIKDNRRNAIVVGEDDEAVNTVSELLSSAGFNPIITTAFKA